MSTFIFETIRKLFEFLLANVVQPLITTSLSEALVVIVAILVRILAWWLYIYMLELLTVVDMLQGMFDVFAGLAKVGITGQLSPAGPSEDYLINIFFGYSQVSRVFWGITLISFVLAFAFTIYSVARSAAGDLSIKNPRTIGKVLGDAGKAALSFLVVPFFCIVAINLSTLVLQQIDTLMMDSMVLPPDGSSKSTTFTQRPTLGTVIYLTGSLNAAQDNRFNGGRASFYDEVRYKYYVGLSHYTDFSATVVKTKKGEVAMDGTEDIITSIIPQVPDGKKPLKPNIPESKGVKGMGDFFVAKFDFFAVYIIGCLVAFVLFISLFLFVRRIFEVIMLYIMAPLFVATIVLDGGQRFKRWRDIFVGKLLSAYGVVITMKLYLMLMPIIVSPGLSLGSDPVFSYTIKLMIIFGGAWAVYKSNSLILSIISPEAAAAASESLMMVAALAKKAADAAIGAAMAAATGGGSAALQGAGKAAQIASKASSAVSNVASAAGEGDEDNNSQAFKGK